MVVRHALPAARPGNPHLCTPPAPLAPPCSPASSGPDPAKLAEAVRIRDLLGRNTEELRSVARALNGEYILPEAGGDLLRDGAGTLGSRFSGLGCRAGCVCMGGEAQDPGALFSCLQPGSHLACHACQCARCRVPWPACCPQRTASTRGMRCSRFTRCGAANRAPLLSPARLPQACCPRGATSMPWTRTACHRCLPWTGEQRQRRPFCRCGRVGSAAHCDADYCVLTGGGENSEEAQLCHVSAAHAAAPARPVIPAGAPRGQRWRLARDGGREPMGPGLDQD